MNERLKHIIAAGGGGAFRGVNRVPAFGKPAYYIVFFDSPATGSTMCMKVRGLTAESVKQHLEESNIKFGIYTLEHVF